MATSLTVLNDPHAVPEALRGAYVAIGNFDGLHSGHRVLIQEMAKRARAAKKPAAVLTFEPHPRQYFAPDKPFFRLTPGVAKELILGHLGLDALFVLPFNAALAQKSAPEFVALLKDQLGIGGVVVGADFHFGRNREGTPERLKALCAENAIDFVAVEPVRDGTAVISSSLIRAALTAGDVAHANALLGYRWFVRSTVIHGAKRGRELGFPTANLPLERDCGLRLGGYSVRAQLPDGRIFNGVASFGKRPMFDNGAPLLEVFLFGFSGDLYGQALDVEVIGWIRPEQKFAGLDALIAAIRSDAEIAQRQIAADAMPSMLG